MPGYPTTDAKNDGAHSILLPKNQVFGDTWQIWPKRKVGSIF